MPVYRQVQTNFWQDPFILDLPFEEKAFYLYLITNSKTKQCGIYEISIKVIELDTGLAKDKIENMLTKFTDMKKIKMDSETREILIINWTKNNYNASPKVQLCIKRELRSIKSKNLLEMYNNIVIEYLNSNDALSKEKKEEEKKEIEEEGKEALLLEQITSLLSILDIEPHTDNKLKCRSLLLKHNYSKMKDAFNKAADLGIQDHKMEKVEEILSKN